MRNVGVAMTVSPIRLGQKTAIFIDKGAFPSHSVDCGTASRTGTSGSSMRSRVSRPSMISSPMRTARKGMRPRLAVRSLTKSFCVVKARFPPCRGPSR